MRDLDVSARVPSRSRALALVTKLALTLPVLWDSNKKIAAHYRPEGMPATFVLDPSGTVVYRHVGSGKKEWDEMVEFLEKASKR